MQPPMLLTPATFADADALADFVNGAYRGERATAGWAHEAGLLDGQRTDPATLRATLGNGRTAILLARERDGAPLVGCVSLEPAGEGTTWALGMLTIDPAAQAAGLGRRLLAEAESYARVRGAARIRITVIHLRDTLIAWYERRGYRLTGETEPFPYGDPRVGIPLRPDLRFVVLDKVFPDNAGR